jgi:hypothetical protein
MGNVTHFYVAKRFGHRHAGGVNTVKLLCTGTFIELERRHYGVPGNACTVPGKVTCPECLGILIPRQETLLSQMRANLAKSAAPLIDWNPVPGWAPLLEFGTVAEMQAATPDEPEKPRKARCQDSPLTVYVWDSSRRHWAASARSPV